MGGCIPAGTKIGMEIGMGSGMRLDTEMEMGWRWRWRWDEDEDEDATARHMPAEIPIEEQFQTTLVPSQTTGSEVGATLGTQPPAVLEWWWKSSTWWVLPSPAVFVLFAPEKWKLGCFYSSQLHTPVFPGASCKLCDTRSFEAFYCTLLPNGNWNCEAEHAGQVKKVTLPVGKTPKDGVPGSSIA